MPRPGLQVPLASKSELVEAHRRWVGVSLRSYIERWPRGSTPASPGSTADGVPLAVAPEKWDP